MTTAELKQRIESLEAAIARNKGIEFGDVRRRFKLGKELAALKAKLTEK